MSSEIYLLSVRKGSAIARYEILERIIRNRFKEECKMYKYKLRRLSDLEVEELLMELAVAKDSSIIRNYV